MKCETRKCDRNWKGECGSGIEGLKCPRLSRTPELTGYVAKRLDWDNVEILCCGMDREKVDGKAKDIYKQNGWTDFQNLEIEETIAT